MKQQKIRRPTELEPPKDHISVKHSRLTKESRKEQMLQTLSLGVATFQFDPLYTQQYTTLGRQSNHSDDISTCVHDSGKP